jgi:sulfate permease, SulP family
VDIIQKIKELNLPKGQYVVIGSGVMDILGIRRANDIDLSVTKELHQKLRKTGEWEEFENYGKIFLKKDVFEINGELNWDKYKTTTEEAIKTAFLIDGISFMNIEELLKFKMASGREKDFKDIELIKEYIKNN